MSDFPKKHWKAYTPEEKADFERIFWDEMQAGVQTIPVPEGFLEDRKTVADMVAELDAPPQEFKRGDRVFHQVSGEAGIVLKDAEKSVLGQKYRVCWGKGEITVHDDVELGLRPYGTEGYLRILYHGEMSDYRELKILDAIRKALAPFDVEPLL